jgi:hypothetical protein
VRCAEGLFFVGDYQDFVVPMNRTNEVSCSYSYSYSIPRYVISDPLATHLKAAAPC